MMARDPSPGPVYEGPVAAAPGLARPMAFAAADVRAPAEYQPADGRTVVIAAIAVAIGVAAAVTAQLLIALIGLVTNLAYYGRFSTGFVSPAAARLGIWAVAVPVVGGLIVGLMARWGSPAIRGHGIPEVMEKVLLDESRIPARLMVLKPLSAAIAIGTGGPFGAEGPIIATGGALGSIVGQTLRITADERKTLLAAGAAAGMAATFGAPVAAVLLAVELLLFEYRPRSLVPVALAAAAAAAMRIGFVGAAPVFFLPELRQPSGAALVSYACLGALVGAVAAAISRAAYAVEDAFEHLPIHWMWWPALGAVAVGIIGLIEPRTLGVGYDNISGALSGTIAGRALAVLVVLKFLSWAVYLGSGTSGGTLAPLFTIGGGAGALAGSVVARVAPGVGVDPHVAALVGMAAIFAGASHALLASIVFAFETTRQAMGLLPLLAGCTAAYLVALLASRHSIMTEKLARRGTAVRAEYAADHLAQVLVRDVATGAVVSLHASDRIGDLREWLRSSAAGASHQGFPVVDESGLLIGVVTRRDILDAAHPPAAPLGSAVRRPPAVVFDDNSLRDAADHMVVEGVGRLPVVRRSAPSRVIGIVTRSDLLAAHATRLRAARSRATPRLGVGAVRRRLGL